MIDQIKKATKYTTQELCSVLDVRVSTYYYQIKSMQFSPEEIKLISTIKSIAKESGDTYGKRRIQPALKLKGFNLGLYKTASMMKKANIIAITPKKKHYYADGGKSHPKAANILNRAFTQKAKHTHWVGDITYCRTHQGWSYLACVLDLGTKEIVGWSISKTPDAVLAKAALEQAIKKHQPDTTKLLFHSDQGVQYSSHLFVKYLKIMGITQSMSRRGNCWDNSVMERFFRSLKTERLNHLSFINHAAVVSTIESYIYFYNYKRLHSVLGYITPAQKAALLKKAA